MINHPINNVIKNKIFIENLKKRNTENKFLPVKNGGHKKYLKKSKKSLSNLKKFIFQ